MGKLFINPDGLSFFLSPTVPGEIENIIDALDMKKSTGPNGVPVYILKIFKLFFSLWLSRLVNLCFEVGEFPDVIKIAKASMVCFSQNFSFRVLDTTIHIRENIEFIVKKIQNPNVL